ncbi:MAG: IS1634 family transposase, partial [Bdellovibrionota bacterium]
SAPDQSESKQDKPLSVKTYSRLRDVVLGRLADPCSKHKTHQQLMEHFDKAHDLDAIYRMMDSVDGKIEFIKDLTFEKTKSLFPRGVSILLFDVTTLYFESVEEDELRAFGYSKDHRFNTTQVVLALATNTEGLPIGYELFEGNCAEVKTLMASINRWKERFSIGSVCFVADRAMMSYENVALLEANHCQYIIAAKLKGLPEELKEEILAEKNYKPAMIEDQLNWMGEFEYTPKTRRNEESPKSQRLIVTYKSDRALRDQHQRAQVLKKANKVLGENKSTKNLISNAGLKQYLQIGTATAEIDPEKVRKSEAWDGMHGILTNMKDTDARELRARYSRLWKIEESFRINKHTLKMRPIFHWKPERIRAHVAICYMAFSVLRHLEYQVNLSQKISVQKILEALINVQASIHIHKITKDRYRLPSAFPLTASKIYKAFDLKRSQDAEPYLV